MLSLNLDRRYSVIVVNKYSLGQREFKGSGEIARLSERFDAEQMSVNYRAGNTLKVRYRPAESALSVPIRPDEGIGKVLLRIAIGLLISVGFYWFGQRLLRQWEKEKKSNALQL